MLSGAGLQTRGIEPILDEADCLLGGGIMRLFSSEWKAALLRALLWALPAFVLPWLGMEWMAISMEGMRRPTAVEWLSSFLCLPLAALLFWAAPLGAWLVHRSWKVLVLAVTLQWLCYCLLWSILALAGAFVVAR
jgi:hypothetical protein